MKKLFGFKSPFWDFVYWFQVLFAIWQFIRTAKFCLLPYAAISSLWNGGWEMTKRKERQCWLLEETSDNYFHCNENMFLGVDFSEYSLEFTDDVEDYLVMKFSVDGESYRIITDLTTKCHILHVLQNYKTSIYFKESFQLSSRYTFIKKLNFKEILKMLQGNNYIKKVERNCIVDQSSSCYANQNFLRAMAVLPLIMQANDIEEASVIFSLIILILDQMSYFANKFWSNFTNKIRIFIKRRVKSDLVFNLLSTISLRFMYCDKWNKLCYDKVIKSSVFSCNMDISSLGEVEIIDITDDLNELEVEVGYQKKYKINGMGIEVNITGQSSFDFKVKVKDGLNGEKELNLTEYELKKFLLYLEALEESDQFVITDFTKEEVHYIDPIKYYLWKRNEFVFLEIKKFPVRLVSNTPSVKERIIIDSLMNKVMVDREVFFFVEAYYKFFIRESKTLTESDFPAYILTNFSARNIPPKWKNSQWKMFTRDVSELIYLKTNGKNFLKTVDKRQPSRTFDDFLNKIKNKTITIDVFSPLDETLNEEEKNVRKSGTKIRKEIFFDKLKGKGEEEKLKNKSNVVKMEKNLETIEKSLLKGGNRIPLEKREQMEARRIEIIDELKRINSLEIGLQKIRKNPTKNKIREESLKERVNSVVYNYHPPPNEINEADLETFKKIDKINLFDEIRSYKDVLKIALSLENEKNEINQLKLSSVSEDLKKKNLVDFFFSRPNYQDNFDYDSYGFLKFKKNKRENLIFQVSNCIGVEFSGKELGDEKLEFNNPRLKRTKGREIPSDIKNFILNNIRDKKMESLKETLNKTIKEKTKFNNYFEILSDLGEDEFEKTVTEMCKVREHKCNKTIEIGSKLSFVRHDNELKIFTEKEKGRTKDEVESFIVKSIHVSSNNYNHLKRLKNTNKNKNRNKNKNKNKNEGKNNLEGFAGKDPEGGLKEREFKFIKIKKENMVIKYKILKNPGLLENGDNFGEETNKKGLINQIRKLRNINKRIIIPGLKMVGKIKVISNFKKRFCNLIRNIIE